MERGETGDVLHLFTIKCNWLDRKESVICPSIRGSGMLIICIFLSFSYGISVCKNM